MTEFLTRIGDRINPIVVKETRQAVNSRLVTAFLLLFLVLQLVVMILMVATSEFTRPDDIDMYAGRNLFTFVQGILLGTCLVLIPALTGMRLAVERSDVNVDLLFISSLTPRAVLSGKLIAAAALALLIFSACAPFMTFAYVMRGLDIPTIFVVLLADYLAVLMGTMFALFLASIPANRGLRIFLGVGGFVCMGYLGLGLLGASYAFLRRGSDLEMDSWEFWLSCLGLTALIFGGIGLLFVWSVALISPPAANRAFAVRVYTLGFWIATGIGFATWSAIDKSPEPVFIWGLMGCMLSSLQIVIGSCERDHWGARVACRIPRNPALRFPAFLFYSGAHGGIIFGVIGAVLTTIVVAVWGVIIPPLGRFGIDDEPVILAGLIAGYTYCFSLTAVLFRRLLASSGFPCGYTWLLGAILFGLGCIIPFLINFAFFDRYSRYESSIELRILYLPNPVVTIDDSLRTASDTLALAVIFLVVWGVIATAVNGLWFVKQLVNFHPPRSKDEADE